MSDARWQRLNEIFQGALAQDSGDWPAYVEQACAGDESLRLELEELLHAHHRAELNSGAMAQFAIRLHELEPAAPVGRRIGSYRASAEIGRGGMGTVLLADRVDGQFEQRVAIKVIKRGMDTAQILDRFRVERQILASLDHPHIARLVDGGTTDDGLPYFVMEYIEGQAIDHYADERRLSVRQRLDLFLQVCDAVSYAHQHLIVHRDIKPQNILVTTGGMPKLLDFGIAKVLQEASDQGTLTRSGHQLLTPDYASPEQVEGRPTTTQTDVYSLGVVLYELLTGRSPYQPRTWSAPDVCESVRSSEVERPSAAVGRRADGATSRGPVPETDRAAATAAGSLDRLRGQLRGDLDAIVLSALHKDTERRYASVEQLASDIRRHLNGLPVRARADSVWYRGAKFVRRNRAGVTAAGLIALTLVGGALATAWQARNAQAQARIAQEAQARAERRFNEVRQLARSVLFDYHDAIKDLSGATGVRERLVKDGLVYLDRLAGEASGDPALQLELAAAYERLGDVRGQPFAASLGDLAGAMESYLKALRIREALVAASPQDVQNRRGLARSYVRIANQLIQTNEAVRGTDYLRRALAIYLELTAEQPANTDIRADLADTYNELGGTLEDWWDDVSGARENHRKALSLREEIVAADPSNQTHRRNLSVTYVNIGRVLAKSGDTKGALESNQKALASREAWFAENPSNADYRRLLAISYQNDGNYRAILHDVRGALQSFRKKLALDEQSLADDPVNAQSREDLGYSCERIGDLLAESGDYLQALSYYRRAQTMYEGVSAIAPKILRVRYRIIFARAGICTMQAQLGKRAAAQAECSKASSLLNEIRADPAIGWQSRVRGQLYMYLAQASAALATSNNGPTTEQREHWRTARTWYVQALEIWQDMRQRGILLPGDATKPEDVAREIARCDAFLRTPGVGGAGR